MVGLKVASLTGQETTIAEEAATRLRQGLRGRFLLPDSEEYGTARRLWNGMFDRRPAMVVQCANAEDVARCVEFAGEHGLVVAVKGGGHSLPGHSVCEGGLMIDLSHMKGLKVDSAARTATAGAGVVWGEFDRATHEHGLATTGGQITHTGIAGLTLGGGMGWLARSFGLTSDNLLSANIVTADGKLRSANEQENADLFWGIRGGGGNSGVVTSFRYRLHPVGTVLAGLVAHPLSRAPEALGFYREFADKAPDSLTTAVAFITTPDGHPAVGIGMCYLGPLSEGERVIRPLREFGPPVMDQVGPMPYPAVQSMLDHVAVPGRRYYVRSHMLRELRDEDVRQIAEAYASVSSPMSAVLLIHLGGAVARVPENATAYYHRKAAFNATILSAWTDPAFDDKNIRWAKALGDALKPRDYSAVYVNELGADEGEERVRVAYGADTYLRLAAIKKKYDPANLFRLNQNIKPAA